MIGRVWRGWAEPERASEYAAHFRNEVARALGAVAGCRGAYLLRRDDATETEFVTIALFDSLDAVRAFAGEHYERAVVAPGARRALRDYERTVRHYAVVGEVVAPGIEAE